MKFLILSTILALPCALAAPSDGTGHSLLARDKPKLNQYRTMDDCLHDRNILYHAAPSTGNCYDLDGKTGAFFYNTAGFLLSRANKDIGCAGDWIGLRGGRCMEKGPYRSVVMR
ncbi:hypothetical protein PLIIFM63780_008914 [Purpureocillium lilacinum]|uniref:Uncharacterized protein n=1 Tax=Purpureocillium lilacinum TaxID=33203 RepID=A0ACC4DV32_PURLI|nr:hypothetical protein PLIIFM63780_008914 [Purpureocillium lilacinum]